MHDILFQYQRINATSWVYVSSLLMIGLYFKFGRFWSVRNLDLVLLILIAPGLLLIKNGIEIQRNALSVVAEEAKIENASSAGDTLPTHSSEGLLGDVGDSGDDDPASVSAAEKTADLNTVSADPEPAPLQPDAIVRERAEDETDEPNNDSSTAAAEQNDTSEEKSQFDRGRRIELLGFIWIFVIGVLLTIRLLLDPTMVRRPLLEPNLTIGGLTFLGVALFLFLMANVIMDTSTESDRIGPRSAEHLVQLQAQGEEEAENLHRHGPGLAILFLPTSGVAPGAASKTMAILSHLAIVLGIILIGYWHFDNIRMGIGPATLYLILPYTAQFTGRIEHTLPAALLLWTIVCYRRPTLAGMFLGLSIGVVYYPIFLLPLWLSFYWQRGMGRFLTGMSVTLAIVVFSLIFRSADLAQFLDLVQTMFGLWWPVQSGLDGIWRLGWDPVYRMPILAVCATLAVSLAIWPAQKNLGTLLSCSAGVMVVTQFWHGYGGGTFVAWYLPLLLLTIFRPNLEDRVALTVLGESWMPRRAALLSSVDRAA